MKHKGGGKWVVEFPDGPADVHRSHITYIPPSSAATPKKRSRASVVACDDDVDDFSSDDETEGEEPKDAGIPGVVGAISWRKDEKGPSHCQRLKKGFQSELLPIFKSKNTFTRSGPSAFDLWLEWTPLDNVKEQVAHIDEKGRNKYGDGWQTLNLGRLVGNMAPDAGRFPHRWPARIMVFR